MREYLPTLQGRQKWTKARRNIRKGDLVLVIDATTSRSVWKKGLILDLFPGPDGHIRKATVKTIGGSVLKDICSLCLLEGDSSC